MEDMPSLKWERERAARAERWLALREAKERRLARKQELLERTATKDLAPGDVKKDVVLTTRSAPARTYAAPMHKHAREEEAI
jgi:hypothetical protein